MAARPRVTQREIARRLGVTQVTVSRALAGKGPLAPKTLQRVLTLAQSLGYRPNGLARRVQEGRYRGMALLGSSARPDYNIWDQDFHIAVGSALAERSWHLTEGWLPGESLADPLVVDGLLDRMLADAVLIHDVGLQSSAVEEIVDHHHIAAVWVNAGRESNAVDFADAAGACAGLEHLLAQGYRRPALLLNSPPEHPLHISVAERARGFREGCRAAGIAACIHHPDAECTPEELAAFARQVLSSPDRPDSLLCYNIWLTNTVRILAAERGLRLGPDLGLVAFGRPELAVFDLPCTVCAQDYAALGRESVAMAWRLLETGKRQKQIRIEVPVQRPGTTTTRG